MIAMLAIQKNVVDRLRHEIMWLKEWASVSEESDARKAELIKEYEGEVESYVQDIKAAYGIINNSENKERLRQLFDLRYRDGLEWEQVAREMKLTRRRVTALDNDMEFLFMECGRPDILLYDTEVRRINSQKKHKI